MKLVLQLVMQTQIFSSVLVKKLKSLLQQSRQMQTVQQTSEFKADTCTCKWSEACASKL